MIRFLALFACLAAASCAAASPDYYAVAAVSGPAAPGGPSVIEVRTPSYPGYLDRNEIVTSYVNYRVELAPNAAWAEPMGAMLSRALVADLSQRLPGSTVYGADGAIYTPPGARVEVNLQRFDPDASGEVVLQGALVIDTGDGGALFSRPLHLVARPAGKSVSAEAAALSQLLGQVADLAADALRTLPQRPNRLPG